MKYFITLIATVIAFSVGAKTTFTVDENLPEIDQIPLWYVSGERASRHWVSEAGVENPYNKIIASSLENDTIGMPAGRNTFYFSIVKAYGEHCPLVISPEVFWINVCQVFGHYVSENPEKMRPKLVDHADKMQLVVMSEKDLVTGDVEWDEILDLFVKQIGENTKGDIAKVLEAKFSSTTLSDRIASDITLMSAMKPYFDYVVLRIVCGIPSITLTGSVRDWYRVLEKAKKLKKYDMAWYIDDIIPIIKQFISAAEGNPDKTFWQQMVKIDRPEKYNGNGGHCGEPKFTTFDGWFTKLFPYERSGKRAKTHTNESNMLPSMQYTDFKYIIVNPRTKAETTIPMQLWGGIIGVDQDPRSHAITPRAGWFVRRAD